MKQIKYIILIFALGFISCNKLIDLTPSSNITAETYYKSTSDINGALTGCYKGLQKPLLDEWSLTELRSDNTQMGQSALTTSTPNRLYSDLDEFIPSTGHSGVYNYWINTYYNIRNCNSILNALNVNYSPGTGNLSFDTLSIPVLDADRKLLSAEATFIRAYHYFNLVRLYGGVFLIHKPVSAQEAPSINRASSVDIYKLIIADLQNTISYGIKNTFSSIPATSIGRANAWAAKALLAKVYLTLNRKSDAIPLLQDVIINSGYKLQNNYADVFSINNEMNSEILFTVRFKAGGLGLGSTLPNLFGPLASGTAVVNGGGSGTNYPTAELDGAYFQTLSTGSVKKDSVRVVLSSANTNINPGMYVSGTQITAGTTVAAIAGNVLTLSAAPIATSTTAALAIGDARRRLSIGIYGTKNVLYPLKMISNPALINDAENDWPVMRFADVLLLMAEAQGNTATSLSYINQTRARGGLIPLTITTTAQFESALSNERRLEFAFENQRWFDLTRYNTTLTTITVEQRMKDHFSAIFGSWYSFYPLPNLSLLQLQANANTNKMLLPIPQYEIDTNSGMVIPQNPGY